MRIKLTPLDRLFSKCIKLRDKYCQRCGGSNGLQTSHFHGRRKLSTRWDEENCCLLCFGCHLYFTANPLEHVEWQKERLGEKAFEELNIRARIPNKPDINLLTLYYRQKIKEVE